MEIDNDNLSQDFTEFVWQDFIHTLNTCPPPLNFVPGRLKIISELLFYASPPQEEEQKLKRNTNTHPTYSSRRLV